MSQSEPKPKIIYRTLEDLIKSSSLSKNNSSRCSQIASKISGDRVMTEAATVIAKKSVSKHSLQSKDKVNYSNYSVQKTFKKGNYHFKTSLNMNDGYFQEIQNIYCQMESTLCSSKHVLIQNMKNNLLDDNYMEQHLRKLKEISNNLKQIFSQFSSTNSQQSLNNFSENILKNVNQNDIEQLGKLSKLNKKTKFSGRLKNNDVLRKPTIYEEILRKRG